MFVSVTIVDDYKEAHFYRIAVDEFTPANLLAGFTQALKAEGDNSDDYLTSVNEMIVDVVSGTTAYGRVRADDRSLDVIIFCVTV